MILGVCAIGVKGLHQTQGKAKTIGGMVKLERFVGGRCLVLVVASQLIPHDTTNAISKIHWHKTWKREDNGTHQRNIDEEAFLDYWCDR
jgi:hypothetical protein